MDEKQIIVPWQIYSSSPTTGIIVFIMRLPVKEPYFHSSRTIFLTFILLVHVIYSSVDLHYQAVRVSWRIDSLTKLPNCGINHAIDPNLDISGRTWRNGHSSESFLSVIPNRFCYAGSFIFCPAWQQLIDYSDQCMSGRVGGGGKEMILMKRDRSTPVIASLLTTHQPIALLPLLLRQEISRVEYAFPTTAR